MANFCTNCGVSLPDDIKFCTDCGNKIGQEIPIEDKSKEIKEVENRSEISQDVNEIANNEGEIAENKRQISPTKSIENTSSGIDAKYIIIGIVTILIIGAIYTMRPSIFSSGNSNPKNTTDYTSGMLFEEIMDIHDEVMPKMGQIRDKEKKMRKKALSSSNASNLLRTADNLSNVNEKMMSWMRNFNNDFEGSEAEKKIYLLEQKKTIENIKKSMEEALR